jgi:hypothetical protein
MISTKYIFRAVKTRNLIRCLLISDESLSGGQVKRKGTDSLPVTLPVGLTFVSGFATGVLCTYICTYVCGAMAVNNITDVRCHILSFVGTECIRIQNLFRQFQNFNASLNCFSPQG